MIQLLLFKTFTKKTNSTKIPDIEDNSERVDVLLKGETSLLSPTFIINKNFITDRYTYALSLNTSRCYYVTDIVSVRNDVIEIQCIHDPLATFRSAIFRSKQFVTYATGVQSPYIQDTRLLPSSRPQYIRSVLGENVIPNTNESIIITTTSDDPIASKISGGVSIYLLDDNEKLSSLLGSIFKMYDGQDIEQAVKMYMNRTTTDSIRSIEYRPYTPTSSNPTTFKLGTFDSGIEVSTPFNQFESSTSTLNIPWIDDRYYLRNAVYYNLYLYLPFIGVVPLNVKELASETLVYIQYTIDNVNGTFVCIVSWSGSQRLVLEGTTSSSMNWGGVMNNPIQGLLSSASGITQALTGNLTGATSSLISSVSDIYTGDSCIVGNYDTRLSSVIWNIQPYIFGYYREPQAEDIRKIKGVPLASIETLESLEGSYIQCENPVIDENGLLKNEYDAIVGYLENGMWLE